MKWLEKGTSFTVDRRHSFNFLLLADGAVLTHSPCTTTNAPQLKC